MQRFLFLQDILEALSFVEFGDYVEVVVLFMGGDELEDVGAVQAVEDHCLFLGKFIGGFIFG